MVAPLDLSITTLGPLRRSSSVGFVGTEKEHESFYFFRHNTVPQLSGFLGGDFWYRLLLQAALHEPSIRYAILALGALHANHEQANILAVRSSSYDCIDEFVLSNYNHAINILTISLAERSKQAIDVSLICSILFACLEVSCPST